MANNTLNKVAVLAYKTNFNKEKRKVSLKGEAYFKIVQSKEKPFIVKTGNLSTRVTGTAFNIDSEDFSVVVTVVKGSVNIQ
ncbi:MAG: FecR domain-containing protein [Tenacibaculum sp.]